VVLNWGERFHDLPNSPLKYECYQSLKALLEGKGKAFMEAFTKAFGEVYPHPCPNTDPDSLLLITDPKPKPEPEPEHEQRRKKNKNAHAATPRVIGKTVPVWNAYKTAYRERYKEDPVDNARTRGMLARFLTFVPEEEAPDIAAFYLTHNEPWYVKKRHPVNLLLADAEGLRTQWATGIKSTTSEAKNAEFKDNVVSQADRVIALMQRKGTL